MITEVIDLPPSRVLEQGSRKKLFFGSFARAVAAVTRAHTDRRLDSKGVPRASNSAKTPKRRRPASRPLSQILRTTDGNFIDFIQRCFE
jgi:hypothetical protein